MEQIILYSTDCAKCKILKAKLDEAEIKYEVFSDLPAMIEKGFKSVPVLEVNGETMTFLEATNWIKGR